MLEALLLLLVLFPGPSLGQNPDPGVSVAQVEAAVADVSSRLAADDPVRASLLELYDDTRAALLALEQYQGSTETYTQARAGASREAEAIEAGLAERREAPAASDPTLDQASLQELEQRIQVTRADLEARRSNLQNTRAAVSAMPERAMQIRDRLTALGGIVPKLESGLALMPKLVEPGSKAQAELWLARAQYASAVAEKAALDAELLSQPMRLELLIAQQDQASQEIKALERQLQAMERRTTVLRQGEATQAQAEAEKVLADTRGKHPLLQQLADENAALTASFSRRSTEIEHARQRDQAIAEEAEQLESDLQFIEHRLSVLGMSTSVGQILREQQAQLPKESASRAELALIAHSMAESSIRQVEFGDSRRKLIDAVGYVDELVAGLDQDVAQRIREDLLTLARSKRDLVRRSLELENTYASDLNTLEFELQRYTAVVSDYRKFISERLLWIPSRAPFSLVRGTSLDDQLQEVFDGERWLQLVPAQPFQLLYQPQIGLALVLLLVLIHFSPRIKALLVASGREVGYVRTDKYGSTLLALGLSLLQSLKWPLLMLIIAGLFETQAATSELAVALHAALVRGALYFWGLELLRILLLPKGLVVSHFRWPGARASALHGRVIRLEQTFIPGVLIVVFSLALYPREVGGALGALSIIIVLLSMAYFFRRIPEFMENKVAMVLSDGSARQRSGVGKLLRVSLVWVPLAATVGVLFGYIYTALEFSLLLARTVGFCCLVLLLNELGLRWLRLTRRRMAVRVRAELAQSTGAEGDINLEEETLESDPELLSDEGTKLLNLLTMLGVLVGVLAIWSPVLPALGVLDSVELWHQTGLVDGQEGTVPVTLADVIGALFIAVLGWILLRRIPGLLEILLRQRIGVRAASAYAATRVFQYAGTGILVAAVLSSLGGSWSQIQWAVAALSVGIGFGLQEIVANFISGLIILFEQPIRVGDTVTVGTTSGKVTKIRIRATTIRDFDRRELLVPNKEFITQQLLNWSLSDQVTRLTVEVGVAYGSDLDTAMAEVREAAHQNTLILSDPEPIVTFEQFGDNSLLIKVRFFLEQLEHRLTVSSDLMLDINRRLHAKGIVVAFPQRDVHLDASAPLEIRMVDSRRAPPTQPPASE